ncbi:NAD(P)/FAD-dependent oxidoreductase [bacterium]|nr:NAD(P)/FAD-dependent oxidoreductase [bacterium]
MHSPHTVRLIVIGGGASGLMAAVAAARRGARVTVLERMQRVGKKVLATGNGRCNLTNLRLGEEHYHGGGARFAMGIINQFGVAETMTFFEQLGLLMRAEEDGKVFPSTDQASAVLDLLRDELERLGVETVCEAAVQRVEKQGSTFNCVTADNRTFSADRVIVAAGGKSSPNLGSNGAGFKIAEALGHAIVRPVPALVQLKIDAPFLKQLQGVRVQGMVEIRVGETRRREAGEILFTDYGLSGIAVMDLSRIASQALDARQAVTVALDLFPGISEDALAEQLEKRFAVHPARTAEFALVGLLHKRLASVVLRAAGIEALGQPCGELTREQIKALAALMKQWRMTCVGTQSWMFSQVTAGGVDVRQVDRRTLESKIMPGAYFCGEVLDVDADCGGYNLQWAWSSGHLAGTHAAH